MFGGGVDGQQVKHDPMQTMPRDQCRLGVPAGHDREAGCGSRQEVTYLFGAGGVVDHGEYPPAS
jgi:hypothetical protein